MRIGCSGVKKLQISKDEEIKGKRTKGGIYEQIWCLYTFLLFVVLTAFDPKRKQKKNKNSKKKRNKKCNNNNKKKRSTVNAAGWAL
jgi:hypothetical protein